MIAVATPKVASTPAVPTASRRWARLAPWVAFAAAALPLIVPAVAIVVRAPVINWTGDRALTELGVREAAHGHQLLGIGGRFGWRHPGPLWMQLLVPGYEFTGHTPWSLSVGVLAIHVSMVAVAVFAAFRGAGVRGAALMAAGVAVYLRATGLLYWTNLWAGYAFTWPTLALVVVGALAMAEANAGWAVPGALLLGTLMVQTDVSTAPAVAVIGAAAFGVRLARVGPRRFLAGPAAAVPTGSGSAATGARPASAPTDSPPTDSTPTDSTPTDSPPPDSPPPDSRPPTRPLNGSDPTGPDPTGPDPRWQRWSAGPVSPAAAVLLVLAVAAWIPPLVQQATTNPGNLTLLVRFARQGAGGYPLRTAAAAVGAALSVFPLGARWVLHPGVQADLGSGPWWAVAAAVGSVAVTLAVAVVAWRRGRRFAGDLALLSAVGMVAGVIAISRVDGALNFYLLIWITILPVPAVVAAALALAPSRSGRDVVTAAALAVAVAVSASVVATQWTEHDWDRRASADVAAETSLAVRALGPAAHGLVLVHVVTSDTWPDAAGVALQLERGGARIEVDERWVFLFGDAFKPRATAPSAEVWFARPHEAPYMRDQPGAQLLGTVSGIDVYGRA